MSEQEPVDGGKPRNTSITVETGDYVVMGEGLTQYLHGPSRDGIRTSDSRGWNAAADVTDGMIGTASTSGIKSEGEDLTLETVEFLVRRHNADGASWGQPVLLPARVGSGVDCEAPDARDPGYPPLRVQVTRPRMPEGFWKGINRGSSVPPGPAMEAARSLWDAIEDKRPAVQHGVVLTLNAIRTPWLALPSIVQAFRERYGEAASREGWAAIWVVGASEAFAKRLDRAPDE